MLQSLLAYARGAGVDVRWVTIGGGEQFFRSPSGFSNHLHGTPGDGGELGERERAVYENTLADSADELSRLVRPGDIVYLHDPQTAGLIELLRLRKPASFGAATSASTTRTRQPGGAWAISRVLCQERGRLRLLPPRLRLGGSGRKQALAGGPLHRRLFSQEPGPRARRRRESLPRPDSPTTVINR